MGTGGGTGKGLKVMENKMVKERGVRTLVKVPSTHRKSRTDHGCA